MGLIVSTSRATSPQGCLGFNARWEESTFSHDADREDTILLFGAGLSRDLGRDADLSLEYSYHDRDSTVDDLGSNQNRIAARR